MTINRNNFEAYILDYLEGNLDPLLTADLMAFLAENPEYEGYLADFDRHIKLNETRFFPQKNDLKKGFSDLPDITPANFDEFCIASCEGLLDEKQKARLSDYLALHPEKQRDLELYRKLKLQPDPVVQYPNREQLKKFPTETRIRHFWYYALGVAASFALLLMLTIRKPVTPPSDVLLPVSTGNTLTIVYPGPQPAHGAPEKTIPSGPEPIPVTEPVPGSREPVLALIHSKPGTKILPGIHPPPVSPYQCCVPQDMDVRLPGPADAAERGWLGAALARLDFWKAAETAVSGFNYLTEAQVSVEKNTTADGKLRGLQIETGQFTISGNKIK